MRRASPDQPLLRRTRRRLLAWSAGSTLIALLVLSVAIYAVVAASLRDASVAQLKLRAQLLGQSIQQTGPMGEDVTFSTQVVSDPGMPGIVLGGAASGTIGLVAFAFSGGSSATAPAPGAFAPGVGAGSLSLGHSEDLGIAHGPPGASVHEGPAPLPLTSLDDAGMAAAQAGVETVHEVSLEGTPLRVLSEPIARDRQTYVIQVVGDRTAEERTLQVLLVVLLAGSLAVLAAALAVGWVYAGRALVPIRDSLRRQREFAADASHELRTPLATVRAGLEHLRRNPSATVEAQAEVLEEVDAELVRITSLVDDLLLLARTDSGVQEIEHVPVELSEVALDAVERLGPVSRSRRSRVELDVAPVELSGDPNRLRQLVSLLVDNALRHGPQGQVVKVRVHAAAGAAMVDVEDQGPGIRSVDLPHIFERFYRAADAPPGGAGLGLAIARWIAERHGGQLRVENLARGGSRFSASLPLS